MQRNLTEKCRGFFFVKIVGILRRYTQSAVKDRRKMTPISGCASGILTDKGTLPVSDPRKLDDELFMQISDKQSTRMHGTRSLPPVHGNNATRRGRSGRPRTTGTV